MELKKIERATKIVERIKEIDIQISDIEKMAVKVAEGNSDNNFVLNLLLPDKSEDKVQFDEDGSIMRNNPNTMGGIMGMIFGAINGEPATKKHGDSISLSQPLTDIAILQILAVIISERQTERKKLIDKIERL